MFEIIPAIDILNGKCVRLKQGQYDAQTIYSNNPLEMAKKWESTGAKRLHLIDLDGARTGTPTNLEIVKSIAKELKIPIQVGGGIRNMAIIQELLDSGMDRVILGTSAVKNPNLITSVCERFGGRIIVAIDAKGDMPATNGWMYVTKKDYISFAKEAAALGVQRFIYTDISRDGMLSGPNFEGIKRFCTELPAAVIASGGISSKQDVEELKKIGMEGCIIGKALYEGRIKLEEVLS